MEAADVTMVARTCWGNTLLGWVVSKSIISSTGTNFAIDSKRLQIHVVASWLLENCFLGVTSSAQTTAWIRRGQAWLPLMMLAREDNGGIQI